ncbi:alpha/beta fold hydrolase [Naasia lichenicola]|uniref:Alpha/beta hydrolase n=1 Tax=Naasia lichenicola TaxID=2565933 RepID=A0A4S4FRQ6_9MICO|nr:alpha/beta hydrolase [Naasia lichenicola]THG33343.1 alpha/beta hydrolase [Naasia lichenicola]
MPSIALIHGIQSSSTTWWQARADLEDLGWTVHTPTLLGHGGRIVGADQSADLATMADDVLLQLEDEPIDLIVGHSLGSLVALTLVARHPEAARGVLLEDPPSIPEGGSVRDLVGDLAAEHDAALADPPGVMLQVLSENPLWSRLDAEHAVANRGAVDLDAAARFVDRQTWDLPQLIADCPIPLHLLAATFPGSALFEPARSVILDRLDPSVVSVIRSGHSIHRERVALWTIAVTAFAATL